MILLGIFYLIVVLWLSLYGFTALGLVILYLRHRDEQPALGQFDEWPAVTVQVPAYNERYVVERVIDAVAALDYPRERLQIQILDDSSDETTALARARVQHHQARGVDITLIHRENRHGYKAGALSHAMASARGEFLAIFDADFVPSPDFLRRTLPAFAGQADVGFVQARWTYLNIDHSALTGTLALAGDAHFAIEQLGCNRSGLPVNFNGSAGVWRRACIESAGGWQEDTLTEDLDLSYRAQFAGWRAVFLPEVSVASELPAQVAAVKQQQFRWAKGGAQTLRKLFWPLVRSRLALPRKIAALLHLTLYFSHVLMLLFLLTWLPVSRYLSWLHALPLTFLSLSTLGLPLLIALSQVELHRDWRRRLRHLPLLLCLGCGLALSNTWAVIQGLVGERGEFARTPKLRPTSRPRPEAATYRVKTNASVLGEIGLAVFCLFLVYRAQAYTSYGTIPFFMLYVLGFMYVAAGSLPWIVQGVLLRPSADTLIE
ncbi:MAG: glycosyltransferase [Thermoflexales bacterium]|nr:glycosyltransferase [Thermoflexales bacterium]